MSVDCQLQDAFEAKASFGERVADGGDVAGAAGFQGDVDDCFA